MSQTDLVNILTSFFRNNKYSHCRLCLKIILDDYVRLDENISLYDNNNRQPLSEILEEMIGGGVLDKIVGLEAVCTDCMETALASVRFINNCKNSNETLNTLFENILNSLDFDTNFIDENNILYVVLDGIQSKVVIENKTENKNKSTSEKYFECIDCNEVFETLFDIKAHNLTTHDTWTCDTCFEMFASEGDLSKHEDYNHKYKCPDCSVYKSCKESLMDHQDRVHSVYVCKDCGKTCHGLDKLQSHEDKHKTRNSCPKCSKNYTTKEFYDRHVELCLKDMIDPHPIRSTMEKSYVCEKCDKAYSTQGGLRVHNRFAHGNATPHVCPECGKEFTAPSYLKVHMIKHTGEKNFKCHICNNRFVSKEALLYHTRRHTGEKPYSCKICNEKFVNASARAEHIKFKHIGPTLMCEICSRKFVTTHFLKQHISKHHDPTSKLFYGRNIIPSNLPVEQNIRKFIIKTENS